MVYFDTTSPPAAALPATPANAAPAPGDAPKSAAAAFGDLLTLLSGQPADRAPKKGGHAGATRAPQDALGMPFTLGAMTQGKPATDASDKSRKKTAAGTDAPAADDTDTHAGDEKALADNLTWLLAMASAPVKADPLPPAPTTFAGDATGATEKDATACTGKATIAGSVLPAAAAPTNQDPTAATAPAVANLPGIQPQAADSAPNSLPLAPSVADKAPAAVAKAAPAQDAAINTVAPASASNAQQAPQVPAPGRQIGENTAPVAAPSKASANAPATAPVFVPVPAAETRQGDSGSAKRESRGSASEERRVDVAPKLPAAAPTSQLFQVPVDVRAQAATVVTAGSDVTAASRAEIPAEADVPRQIVQAIRMQWADGVGDARIKLQPEYLGELSIAIHVEHGAVTASLQSNTPAVREWIDNNQPMLRQALAEHGLQLDKLTVTEETAQPDWSGNEDPKQKQQEEQARQAQRARRQTTGDTPVFEMVA